MEWLADRGEDAAIAIPNNSIAIQAHTQNEGFTEMRTKLGIYYSCYISPNSGIEAFEKFPNELGDSITRKQGPVLISGDFSALP